MTRYPSFIAALWCRVQFDTTIRCLCRDTFTVKIRVNKLGPSTQSYNEYHVPSDTNYDYTPNSVNIRMHNLYCSLRIFRVRSCQSIINIYNV